MVKHFQIHNVRLGLATNSSSTHSLIFLPDAVTDDPPDDNTNFGWSQFTLSSVTSKRDYLGAAIYENLRRETSDAVALTVAREWSGSSALNSESYIDHQSHLTLPHEWSGKGLDRDFLDDLKRFLETDSVVVLGGNDNDDESHPLLGSGVDLGLRSAMPIEDYAPWVARKDPLGYWVLFNRSTGAKLRVSLSTTGFAATPERSTVPELVDVKITDFCPYDCAYCYQGSTTQGKHADKNKLSSLAYTLGQLRVFEVAIGGGEPTLHPHLESFLTTLKYAGVVANITTKNLTWVKAEALRLIESGYLGAVAYSAETYEDVAKLVEVVAVQPKLKDHINVQHVVGLDEDEFQFRHFLTDCAKAGFRLTLLGFKTTGRGATFGEKKNDKWLSILAEVCKTEHLRVGIDTTLANRHWNALIAAGVPKWCMTRHEGRFSCYVDAVEQKIALSSYADPVASLALPSDEQEFVEAFQSFSRPAPTTA